MNMKIQYTIYIIMNIYYGTLITMVNIGLMIAGILGVIVGIILIAPSGALGTALGAMFLLGGVGIFVMGLLR